MIYKVVSIGKETLMKTILAAILAGTFCLSLPAIVRADDQPAGDSAPKSKKKKEKKADSGDKGAKKDDSKAGGGGW